MTKVFSNEDKQGIKQLFHGALDFMNERNDKETIQTYIRICRKEFIKVEQLSVNEFDQWVKEWEVNK